MEMLR
jgi:calcium-dependent protein kinase